MSIIEYKETDERFEELDPKPFPLVIKKYIRITNDLLYNCLCPISENAIFIDEEGSVGCDVNLDGRTHCKVVGLEHNICPYFDNINKK